LFRRKTIRDIIAFLGCLENELDRVSWFRMFNIFGKIITKDNIHKYLDNWDVIRDREGNEKYSPFTGEVLNQGFLSNFSIRQHSDYYSFSGSLTKYKLGHNFRGINIAETREAIEEISDRLHTDFSSATLTQIDFGNCFETAEIPEAYFPILGYLNNHLTRTPIKSSLYYGYSNNYRKLIFYDKHLAYKAKGETIPEYTIGKNYLRYELKLKRLNSLKKKINQDNISVSDLTNENNFNCIKNEWYELYNTITKQPKELINMTNENLGLKELKNYCFRYYIERLGGMTGFREWIELEIKRGNIKKGAYKKEILDRAKEVISLESAIKDDSLIQELNGKVREVYESN